MKPGQITSENSLSTQLRVRTAPLHRQTENLLGLPGAIHSRDDYLTWLVRFFGLYGPLERLLTVFSDWEAFSFTFPSPSHGACLAGDLTALGVDPDELPRIASHLLPDLSSFAHAVGTLYVLEGATLGGRLILRDLETRLGASIAGATRFFGGRGEAVGPRWQNFRAALDRFGCRQPELRADVVIGAERAFRAFLDWFAPFSTTVTDVQP
jgi:heme oxygenase